MTIPSNSIKYYYVIIGSTAIIVSITAFAYYSYKNLTRAEQDGKESNLVHGRNDQTNQVQPLALQTAELTADVVVVGAGLSGLSAAYSLISSSKFSQKELKVLILEARDRVGGRTNTISVTFEESKSLDTPVSNKTLHTGYIDFGAQWIGPLHSELLSLVEQFDLQLLDQYYPPNDVVNSNRLTECVGYKCELMQKEDALQVDFYMNLIHQLSSDVNTASPWDHPSALQLDTISIHDHINQHISSEPARKEVLLFAQTVLAFSPDQISFLFFLFYVKSGGGMASLGDGELGAQKWKVKGGAENISIQLTALLQGKGVRVMTSCPVVSVKTKKNQNIDCTEIVCSNGQIIHSKRVVFAISPQLVAGIEILPELPNEKQQCCKNIVAGHAIKVYIIFKSAFWLNNSDSPDPYSLNAHFTDLGYVHNIFHSTFVTSSGEFPALVGLITGSAALEFEVLSPSERRIQVLAQLSKMYATDEIPLYYGEKIWAEEVYSGGCYAGISPPTGVLAKYGMHVRSSVGSLHFASTETASEYYGYMEGAIRAGKRAAGELLNDIELF